MKRIVPIILIALALAANIAAKVTSHKGEVAGSYNFLFSYPDSNKPKSDSLTPDSIHAHLHPLVVFLHGSSLCGNNLDRVRRYGPIDAIEKGRRIDAFVLAPQNPGGAWRQEKVMKLVDWALEN